MGIDPKEVAKTAQDIAADSVKKASEIVSNAGEIVKGNVSEGTSGIVKNSTDIATGAFEKSKDLFSKKDDDKDSADA